MKINLFENIDNKIKLLESNSNNLCYFDYIGDKILTVKNGLKKFEDNNLNQNFISEGSLSRLLQIIQNKDFAILTAYRQFKKDGSYVTKQENIIRNRDLRTKLNSLKLGVHQLIGHWRECKDTSIPYDKCKEFTDAIERSYLIPKPDNMESKKFKDILIPLMTIDNETQDGFILKNDNGINIIFKDGSLQNIGKNITLNKISQAYSQYIKKAKIPFVFEGLEIPNSNISALTMKLNNILFIDYPFKVM